MKWLAEGYPAGRSWPRISTVEPFSFPVEDFVLGEYGSFVPGASGVLAKHLLVGSECWGFHLGLSSVTEK